MRKSILDPYKPLIHAWMEEDKNHWSKQHHTAKCIYGRLVLEEGYSGSYDTIRKYVHGIRKDRKQKATQKLVWLPGFAEVDFGEADFYEENICRRGKNLVLSFPYSNDYFSLNCSFLGYCFLPSSYGYIFLRFSINQLSKLSSFSKKS